MVRMLGAMPALAVRQQRRHIKHEEQLNKPRPSTLTIDANLPNHGLATPLRSPRVTPHTSPVHSVTMSPKGRTKHEKAPKANTKKRNREKQNSFKQTCFNGYLFGCISLLHISVINIFIGIIILVIGLIQLAPGSSIKLNKYAFLGCGLGLLTLGFIILVSLCTCQKKSYHSKKSKKKQPVAQKSNVKKKSSLKNGDKDKEMRPAYSVMFGDSYGAYRFPMPFDSPKKQIRDPYRHTRHVETVERTMATLNDVEGGYRKQHTHSSGCHPSGCHPSTNDYRTINELRTDSPEFNSSTPSHRI